MENATSVKASFGGGMHDHLGLVLTAPWYLQVTGYAFTPPVNPIPTLVILRPFMTIQEAETAQQNHKNALVAYCKFINTNKALVRQLVEAIGDHYIKALKQIMFGYNCFLQ
eukprot:8976310-Ditylum_brightwellii.AAC.1